MKLFLTSSGISNLTLAHALGKLLKKPFEESSITFIPTAANLEPDEKSWLVNDFWNLKTLGFPIFDIVDIAIAPKDIWLPKFERADLLVFGGGITTYLREWIKKSGVEAMLPKFLETKVYMGISAGSMVTANTISLTSENLLYYEKKENFQPPMKGLGFVDFEIRPHLNSPYFPKVTIPFLENVAKKDPVPFYAIDDNTAIQVVDGTVTVVSEGTWKKFNE